MSELAYDGFTTLSVRVDDINYGGHLGHDRLITLLHQARLDFLAQLGGDELNLYGISLIMRRLTVDYLAESHLGDTLSIYMRIGEVKKTRFNIAYLVKCADSVIAEVETLMVGFDYQDKKVVALPDALLEKFAQIKQVRHHE